MAVEKERSQLLKTAYGLVDAYGRWDMDAIMENRAPNCTQQVFPTRLGRPALNNEEYRKYFEPFMAYFDNYTMEVLEAVEDSEHHKVVLHIRATAQTPVGEYDNEFSVFVRMTEDDQRINRIKEFVDSGFSITFFQKLRAHMESQVEGT
jgi:ketosteroid isomerase-like protein